MRDGAMGGRAPVVHFEAPDQPMRRRGSQVLVKADDLLEGHVVSRRGTTVTLGSLALVASSLVWAPTGQAGTGRYEAVTCTGNAHSSYDPPLTLTPRETRNHADVRYTCTTAPGRTVPATGSFDAVAASASCVSLSSASGTETVRYADGGRSVIVIDGATTARVAGVLVVLQSGRVNEGHGEGHFVRRTVTSLPQQLPTDCLTSGLQGTHSAVQLEILP
ncbi:hypothetical protein [Streptantibioticus ferralitis]|uniref:Uncharacterized protein n=1 Tax=Streptantibioticus ferralitis TaxID=236510 RepID=A0ABT5Z500_9ACTN|nr:hypothetical protein [Streptantibioticus ferralitis]MDF2258904.1 hypothetical protein [Streptantibioticus ferralitis]